MKKAKHKRIKDAEKVWNKNYFLIFAGTAMLLSGISMFYFNKPKQENIIVRRMSDDEARRRLMPVNEPHDVELSENESLDLKMGLMNSHGVGLDDIVVEKATEHSWIVPFDSPKDFSQSQEELTSYIDSLFQFVNHSKIVKPKISIVVPKRGDEVVDLTQGDAVQVYAVRLTGDKLTVYYSIKTRNQTISSDSNKLFYNEGHTGTFYSYDFNQELRRLTFLDQKRGNIFYAPRDDLDKVETVPIECLHRAFAPWTAANIHRHIDGYYEDHDSSNNMVPWIINRDTEIEEGLVHAIAYLWLKQNLGKFPTITQQDLDKELEHYRVDERYKMVEFALEVIQKNGLERTIDMYTSGQLNLHVK